MVKKRKNMLAYVASPSEVLRALDLSGGRDTLHEWIGVGVGQVSRMLRGEGVVRSVYAKLVAKIHETDHGAPPFADLAIVPTRPLAAFVALRATQDSKAAGPCARALRGSEDPRTRRAIEGYARSLGLVAPPAAARGARARGHPRRPRGGGVRRVG